MVALAILGLVVWLGWLTLRQNDLLDRLSKLERRPAPTPEPRVEAAPEPKIAPARRAAAEAAAAPVTRAPQPQPATSWPELERMADARPAPKPTPKPAGPPPRELVAAWLSENGLAWIGGAVLALGGAFLVAYAAEKGFFTPAMRIASATALGAVLIGVSEWLRRQADRDARGHRLAAAATAGAGAATLYAAAWASYWLYSFIGLAPAAGLLGLVSLGLLALSVRHGEPLAILAVAAALLAPVVTGPQHWDAPALTGYLALVVITGYAASGARRWGQAGLTTLAGAVLWAAAGFAAEGYVRVAALAVGPLALALAATAWRRRRGDEPAEADSFSLGPTAALLAAAVLVAALWFVGLKGADLAAAALGAIAVLGLAAVAVRRSMAAPYLQLAAHLAAGAMAVTLLGFHAQPGQEWWMLAVAVAAAGFGLLTAAGARSEGDRLWATGAPLCVLALGLAANGPLSDAAPYGGPALAALALGACAAVLARRVEERDRSIALALWIWAATAGLLAALRIASPPTLLPVLAAVVAAVFAVLHVRLGWRGLAGAAIASALAALAALLNPDLLRPLFAGHAAPIGLAASAAIAAAVSAGASRLIREREPKAAAADSLATAAILIAVTGAGLMLRYWGAKGGGAWRLDPFAESGLRTVTILAAGLLSTLAVREDSHPIGRWRGHVLLGLGAVQALFLQVFGLNPLWASWVPAVSGPPLADSLALGYLAPALLLGAAASRRVTRERALVGAYAAAAFGFALVWAVLELRRLFQGASLHLGIDAIGRAEVAAYAVLALLVARGLFAAARQATARGWSLAAVAGGVRGLAVVAGWIAVVFAVLTFGYFASPWWGPINRPLSGAGAAALPYGLYLAGCGLLLSLVAPAAASGAQAFSRAARVGAVAVGFALTSLVVRLAFRGYDLRPTVREASFETWTFSAVWAVFGVGLLVYGAARRNNDLRVSGLAVLGLTLGKIFLFDMAHLDGVVRAASFLAVGGLLLAAAVLARRLGGAGLPGLGAKPLAQDESAGG